MHCAAQECFALFELDTESSGLIDLKWEKKLSIVGLSVCTVCACFDTSAVFVEKAIRAIIDGH